jgi:hypothetical protein
MIRLLEDWPLFQPYLSTPTSVHVPFALSSPSFYQIEESCHADQFTFLLFDSLLVLIP